MLFTLQRLAGSDGIRKEKLRNPRGNSWSPGGGLHSYFNCSHSIDLYFPFRRVPGGCQDWRLDRGDQFIDFPQLCTRDGSPEISHSPAGLKDLLPSFVDIMEQEYALIESRDQLIHIGALKSTLPRINRFQSIQQPGLILLRLQLPDEPRARIAQGFVIEIDGVLCCQQNPQPEGACCLQ